MVPISQLLEEHATLAKKLHRFAFPESARIIAALSLMPEFCANTIRIEVLQHLVASKCKGTVEPRVENLAEWLGKLMANSSAARMEDPVEDVFVSCVNSNIGSFRIFCGVLADGDFWVERLLAFLSDKQNFPPFVDTLKEIVPLLKLSDALAERANLSRYRSGGGIASGKIQIPRWRDLLPRIEAVQFTATDLQTLGITIDELLPFNFDSAYQSTLTKETLWNSSLERYPLLIQGDKVSILAPSSICRATIRFIVERVHQSGMGGWAEMFYHMESASIFVNEVAKSLDIEPIHPEPPPWPDALPNMFRAFGVFDIGKPVLIFTYCPEIFARNVNLSELVRLSDGQENTFEEYLHACAAQFEKIPGFSGGLILVALAGIGGSGVFRMRNNLPKWHAYAATLPDWLTMASDSDCTAMQLWKLGEQENFLAERSIKLFNLAGMCNLFAFWKKNDFRLVPKEMDYRSVTTVHLDHDFAESYRRGLKQTEDLHCEFDHDRTQWIKLRRYNSQSLFEEDEKVPIYADIESSRRNQLIGCVEAENMQWWVVMPPVGSSLEARDLNYQLWSCIMNWMRRVSSVVQQIWMMALPRSAEINVELPDIEKWDLSKPDSVPREKDELTIDVDVLRSKIRMSMPKGFFGYFNTEENIAERRIVTSILIGIAALSKISLAEQDIEEITWRVVGNKDTRYFHIISPRGLEQFLAGQDKPRPLFVNEADVASSQLGLADLVGRSHSASKLTGLAECVDFLRLTVEKIWERIEFRLKLFTPLSVVQSCFHALDELTRDENHWDMATRSVLALNAHSESAHTVVDRRRADRAKVSMGNRLIIETVQYAGGIANGQIFTQADHLTLLAEFAVLLELAHHRDAIAYGFIHPEIRIFPNGEIDVDQKFYTDVMHNYLTRRSRRVTAKAVADYGNYFPNEDQGENLDNTQADRSMIEYDKAFAPEFGFSIRLIFNLFDNLHQFAVDAKTLGGEMPDRTLRELLKFSEFSETESTAFLDRFGLPVRRGWDSDFPARCNKKDVYPWRFRRQISLLARPLVKIVDPPGTWFVSVPFIRKSLEYWLTSLLRGHLPDTYFESKAMRSYIGNVVNQRGHAFAKRVEASFIAEGFLTKFEIELTALGALKSERLGDIDVLAWNASGRVFFVECKRLLPALTVREVIQRIEDFKGNKKEKDSLGKHLRRIDWLSQNLSGVASITGIPTQQIQFVALLVTSEIVPMQFFREMHFPTDQVVPHEQLGEYLAAEKQA